MRNLSLAVALFSLAECPSEDDLSVPAPPALTSPIRINEVVPRGTRTDGWVELFNPTASTIELSDWTVTSADKVRGFTLPAGAIIPPRGFLVIDEASFPAGLGATDTVHLFNRSGDQVDSFTWSQIRDTDYGRCPDGGSDLLISSRPREGRTPARETKRRRPAISPQRPAGLDRDIAVALPAGRALRPADRRGIPPRWPWHGRCKSARYALT